MWGLWPGEGSAFSGKLIVKLMPGQYQLKKEVKESRNNVCKWCLFRCLNDVYVLPSLPWNSHKWLYWDPELCCSVYWLHCVSGTNYRRLVSRSELRIDFLMYSDHSIKIASTWSFFHYLESDRFLISRI